MLTRAFYTIPRTGLSLRISFVPDTPVRFSVFLDGYVRIIITGSIKVYQLGIAIIFIFGCCPAEIFARIIFFAGKVYAYFIIRWIPGTGVGAERNVRVGCLYFFTGKRHEISNVFSTPFQPFPEIFSWLRYVFPICIFSPTENIFGEVCDFFTDVFFKLLT